MRRFLGILVLLAACGGDKPGPTGPAPVATVSLSVQLSTIGVGATTTIAATLRDAQGNVLTGHTIAWTSSSNAIATVSAAGVVTGVSAGTAVITAAAGGQSAQTSITVTAGGPNCSGITPLSMALGEVHPLTAAERQTLCLAGGTAGAEYVLIPFNNATASTIVPFSANAAGTVAPAGPPLAASALRAGAEGGTAATVRRDDSRALAFDRALRARERAELSPRARRTRGALGPMHVVTGGPDGRRGIVGLGASPALGTLVTMNTSSTSACTGAQNRTARVAAVSAGAIVLADTAAPAGGYTDAEYLSIATTFDTLIQVVDTTAFGAPWDMDANGKVVLLFTNAVNQLTPAGSTGFIGGFFYGRDLFPQTTRQFVGAPAGQGQPITVTGCATSNEGEMFYLPVVDPNSVYNGFFRDKAAMLTEINSTVAHEYQHLINASRRIYVTVEEVEFEDVWLNESMSHLAEELLYFRVVGFAPKQDLTFAVVAANQARLNAINAYQVDNLGRLISYLQRPDGNSPYSPNDSLATRGAGWQLLRQALDLSPNAQNTYTRALVNSPQWGKANFDLVFAGLGGLTGATRGQVLANFFDNTTIAVPTQYAHPSWNFRDLLPRLSGQNNQYALVPKTLLPNVPQTLGLTGGGSGYLRFRVGSGISAAIQCTSGGGALPASVELILVRTS